MTQSQPFQQIGWVIFFRLSEYMDALEKYQEAIEKRQQSGNDSISDSMLASFSHNAGVCLFHMEKFKEAITKFEIAKDICCEPVGQRAVI